MVDQPFERTETIDAVWRAVEGLTVDLKMALLLRDVVGLSYTEIADALEITLATVKWRIYKARVRKRRPFSRVTGSRRAPLRPLGRPPPSRLPTEQDDREELGGVAPGARPAGRASAGATVRCTA